MKKRNMLVISMMLLVAVLIGGGTFAWFTASADEVVNEFTAGTVDLELIDEFEGACNVNPGDCYDKVVKVKNTGTKRAVVRVKADFNGLPGGQFIAGVNGQYWMKVGDYWVYKKVLYPGQETKSLFKWDKVCISACLPNEYQGAEFNITINGDAIQATHQAPWWNGWGVYVCGLDPDWDYCPPEEGSRSATPSEEAAADVTTEADAAALAEIAEMEAEMEAKEALEEGTE